MSFNIHSASLPYLSRFLRALDRMLDKAAAFAEAKQAQSAISVEASIINGRLAPDMFAFARQIQIATDMAKGCAARTSRPSKPQHCGCRARRWVPKRKHARWRRGDAATVKFLAP